MISPDSQAPACPLSGRNSTYRPVQNSGTTSEELVAELCAAFLCAEFSIDGDLRHAGYIQSWVGLLKADKRAFFTSCSKAQAAADYLRGLALRDPGTGSGGIVR